MPKRGPFWHPGSLTIQSLIATDFLRGVIAFALPVFVFSIGRDALMCWNGRSPY
jgi:hypothetical protein